MAAITPILISGGDFQGLLPAIVGRNINQHYTVAGKNFLFDAKGPKSGFGNTISSYDIINDYKHTENFEVDGQRMVFTDSVVLGHDRTTKQYYPLYDMGASYTATAPWTMAFVGNVYYFLKDGMTSYITYTPATGIWDTPAAPSGFPSGPKALARVIGRLVCLGDTLVSWSALDDGTDFVPSLTTGAGAQATSMISGTTYMVKEISAGMLVFTSQGSMLGEFTGGPAVFAWRPLSTTHKILNPFCVITLSDDKEVVFLDNNGFFSTENPDKPAPWQPIMSEYLKETLFPSLATVDDIDAVKLFYNEERELLFVSIKESGTAADLYDYAWCWAKTPDKWSLFNQSHYSFGCYSWSYDGSGHFDLGFLTNSGEAHSLNEASVIEIPPIQAIQQGLWFADFEYPVRRSGSNYIMPNRARMYGWDFSPLDNLNTGYWNIGVKEQLAEEPDITTVTQQATWEDITFEDWEVDTGDLDYQVDVTDEDWQGDYDNYVMRSDMAMSSAGIIHGYTETDFTQNHLDSYVTLGLFRFEEKNAAIQTNTLPEQTNQIQSIGLGMPEGTPYVTEDWELLTGNEDWESTTGDEDWGEGEALTSYTINMTLIASNDGLEETATETPAIAHDGAGVKYYDAANVRGVYHMIKLEATTVGEYYHVETLKLGGIVTGVL